MPSPPPTWAELRDQLIDLYQQQDWPAALALLDQHAPRFQQPAEAADIIYWQACFLCLLGQPDKALRRFEEGLARGFWWNETIMRTDADLAPLQGNPAFEAIIAASIRRLEQASRADIPAVRLMAEPPPTTPSPYPLLLALHAYRATATNALPYWSPLAEHGWLVAALQSSQLASMDGYHWNDEETSKREVAHHLAELRAEYPIDPNRLALGGFSNGGRTSLMLALSGTIPAGQVISLGASLRDETLAGLDWQRIRAGHPPRILMICGENDGPVLERMAAQAGIFVKKGLEVDLQVVPGVGHVYPVDFVARVLDWLA
jgi:predicted esterase